MKHNPSQLTFHEQFAEQQLTAPVARHSDPESSKDAAAEVESRLETLRVEFVRRLRILGQATAQEIAQGEESIRKRAKEVVRDGRVRELSYKRYCTFTKSRTKVMVYEVIENGIRERSK